MYDDPKFDKEWTLNELARRGFVRAAVEFSGGNDEGGVEEITLFRENGQTEDIDPYYGEGYRYVNGRFESIRTELDDDEKLAQQLGTPVYDAYGSFAGEFSVYGKVIFDVANRTVKMEKEEMSGYDYSETEY